MEAKTSELSMRIELIKTKVQILTLKADSYNWECTTPANVKDELEKCLAEIDKALNAKGES